MPANNSSTAERNQTSMHANNILHAPSKAGITMVVLGVLHCALEGGRQLGCSPDTPHMQGTCCTVAKNRTIVNVFGGLHAALYYLCLHTLRAAALASRRRTCMVRSNYAQMGTNGSRASGDGARIIHVAALQHFVVYIHSHTIGLASTRWCLIHTPICRV